MPVVNIAQATKKPKIRDPRAIRQAKRGEAELLEAQGRLKTQEADFHENLGMAPSAFEAYQEQIQRQHEARQTQREHLQTLYTNTQENFLKQAEFASTIAEGGQMTPEREQLFRRNIEQTVEPLASQMQEMRETAPLRGENPDQYPSRRDVLEQHENVLQMAIAEGEANRRIEELEAETGNPYPRFDALGKVFSSQEIREARNLVDNVDAQSRIVSDVTSLVEKTLAEGRDASVIFGPQGEILNFASQMKEVFHSVGGYAAQIIDGDGNVVANNAPDSNAEIDSLATRSDAVGEAVTKLDNKLRDAIPDAEARARYRSGTIQLAYMIARSREPGSPRLSDMDLAMALETIGANLGNPKAMLATVLDNLERNVQEVADRVVRDQRRAGEADLSPEFIQRGMYGIGDLDGLSRQISLARQRVNKLIEDVDPDYMQDEQSAPDEIIETDEGPIEVNLHD